MLLVMPCCLGLLALFTPRLAIVLIVLFSDWLGAAYASTFVPFLGFLFLPLTTIAYAWAMHHGGAEGLRLALVIVALLMDLGLIAGHAKGWSAGQRGAE